MKILFVCRKPNCRGIVYIGLLDPLGLYLSWVNMRWFSDLGSLTYVQPITFYRRLVLFKLLNCFSSVNLLLFTCQGLCPSTNWPSFKDFSCFLRYFINRVVFIIRFLIVDVDEVERQPSMALFPNPYEDLQIGLQTGWISEILESYGAVWGVCNIEIIQLRKLLQRLRGPFSLYT